MFNGLIWTEIIFFKPVYSHKNLWVTKYAVYLTKSYKSYWKYLSVWWMRNTVVRKKTAQGFSYMIGLEE
jgi:hypothetical protein